MLQSSDTVFITQALFPVCTGQLRVHSMHAVHFCSFIGTRAETSQALYLHVLLEKYIKNNELQTNIYTFAEFLTRQSNERKQIHVTADRYFSSSSS